MAKSYRYVQFFTPQGTGYGLFLIDYQDQEKLETGIFAGKVSVAFCNPNDNFLKKRARLMVDGRLRRHNSEKCRTFHDYGSKMRSINGDEFNKFLIDMDKFGLMPGWASRAVKTGRYQLGLKQSANFGNKMDM